MAAHFLNYEAYELYTINGNKIDETYVKWDKEKNKCFAGYSVSGANVGVIIVKMMIRIITIVTEIINSLRLSAHSLVI